MPTATSTLVAYSVAKNGTKDQAVEYLTVEPGVLKLKAIGNDFILLFTDPAVLGMESLVLKKDQPKLLTLPDNHHRIDFEVFCKAEADPTKGNGVSEPPPIIH